MGTDTQTITRNDLTHKLQAPRMYAVIMHNDDITTIDFVVEILIHIFHKSAAEATDIIARIHEEGSGIAGIYTFDIAVTKKNQAEQIAANKGFPLRLEVRQSE